MSPLPTLPPERCGVCARRWPGLRCTRPGWHQMPHRWHGIPFRSWFMGTIRKAAR